MQNSDLETENQHLRSLLNERDETIAKLKFYLEDTGVPAHNKLDIQHIICGAFDPRKGAVDGQDGKTETGRISPAE